MERIITDSAEAEKGVRDLMTLVGSTMGPFGNNVMPYAQNRSQVFRDGAQVIGIYQPDGVIQLNMVQRLRDAAQLTWLLAGDGTSSTTMFLSTLYLTAMAEIRAAEEAGTPIMRRLVAEKVTDLLAKMVVELEAMAVKDIDDDVLEKVATLAAANNPEIGKVVARMVRQIGPNGGVIPEYSRSGKLETSVTPGYAFQAGLYDAKFLPHGAKEVRIENPVIVVVNDELMLFEDLNPIIHQYEREIFSKGIPRPLVIICRDMGGVALATALRREHADQQGRPTGMTLPVYCIRYPKVNPEQFSEDLAALTGATVINKMKGYMLKGFRLDKQGGSVASVVVGMTRTILARGEENAAFAGLVERLTTEVKEMEDGGDLEVLQALKDRLNALSGMVGTIKIPGETQGAASWTQEVVQDSVRSAQSALLHGVLPGCGRALILAMAHTLQKEIDLDHEIGEELGGAELKIAEICVKQASYSVIMQVLHNAGVRHKELDWLLAVLNEAGPEKTFLVDEHFVRTARLLAKDAAFLREPPSTGLSLHSLVDAFDAGVLDSAHAVILSVKNSAVEFPLWIMTKTWVL